MRNLLLTVIIIIAAVYIFLVAAVNDDIRWFHNFSKSLKDSSISKSSLNAFFSEPLRKHLNALINRQDSLARANSIYTKHKSFWVSFYESKGHCYVAIIADFNFYSSKATNGYLNYGDKVITFYGKESKCGEDFVDWNRLNQDKIKRLIDYDFADWKDPVPPPPPPPHEPFRREYLVLSKDSLQLTFEGY